MQTVSKAQREWYERYQITRANNIRRVERGIVARENINA
jgi:hypothetical protein